MIHRKVDVVFTSSTLTCAAVGFAAGLLLRAPVERLVAATGGAAARGPQKPLSPLLTGGVFALLAWRLGPGLDLMAFLVLAAAGVVLALVDQRTLRLPDPVVGALLLSGLSLLGIEALALDDPEAYARAVLGALVLAGYHCALAVFRRGGLGWGDVKLAGVLGLHLSWLGWDVLIVGAVLSFAGAGIAAAFILATRRARPETALPFGPWILTGSLAGVLCGEQLAAAYTAL